MSTSINPYTIFPNISYGPHQRQTYDLYTPQQSGSEKHPLLLVIHGGGWQAGDRGILAGEEFFLKQGFALARIGYRLSHDAIFPAQLHDCQSALSTLIQHADTCGVDPERIAVLGHSAGGHLASLLACRTTEIKAVVNQAGPMNLLHLITQRRKENPDKETSGAELLVDYPQTDWQQLAQDASPSHHLSETTPPHLLIYADADEVVHFSEGTTFHDALQRNGTPSEIMNIPGGHHVDPRFWEQNTQENILSFLHQYV